MKNGFLELMRFIMALFILLLHTRSLHNISFGGIIDVGVNGGRSVEFFFILTGLLLAKKAYENRIHFPTRNIGEETFLILKNKFLNILPFQCFAYVVTFLLICIINKISLFSACGILLQSIPNLFLLEISGLPFYQIVGYEWYLSAMFVSIAIIYPFLKKYYCYFTKVLCPIGSIMLMGYLLHEYGCIGGTYVWTGIAFKGLIRSFTMIMIGCTSYEVALSLNNIKLTAPGKILFGLIEIFGYSLMLLYINISYVHGSRIEAPLILLLALSISITFSTNSILTNFFNRKWCYVLGKLSLPMYLNQYFALLLVKHISTLNMIHGYMIPLIHIAITIILSIICLSIMHYFKKTNLQLKRLFINN